MKSNSNNINIVYIEGRNPILEALKSGRCISKILVDKNIITHRSISELLELAKARSISIRYLERWEIERSSTTSASQGVIAIAESSYYYDLTDLYRISKEKNEPPIYIVLDGIEDPHNFGAIIRTAEATGVHGVIIRERRAVGLTPAAIKASAGAAEYLPVAIVTNIAQSITNLKMNNIWVVGIDMEGHEDYRNVDYRVPTAIVIGSEGKGVSDLVKKRCDIIASIPMKGKISSLNASVAAAVVMYEAFGQRDK